MVRVAPTSNKSMSSSSNPAGKQVSFGESTTHTVESVPSDCKSAVWYNGRQLQIKVSQEITRAKLCPKKQLEESELSWRGLENYQKGYSCEEKALKHTRAVVKEYRSQVVEFGDCDLEDLRDVAKAHSKADRVKARKMGVKDAEAARKQQQPQDKSHTATPPPALLGNCTQQVARQAAAIG
ncbi:hypothetical protein (Partial), partial [Seminavis robusta]|eukprot:Sro1780_g297070.1 n/a (180) ;mRNA; f:22246-22786